jgi:acetyl-CoA carboxylase biotin carboxylase subunit
LIEESPSPAIDAALRARTLARAVAAARAIGYVGAGTMELLLDGDTLRFMEMNCRLQVEHTVSEMRSGHDLVKLQIEAAAGHRLRLTQADVHLDGHALECRINAEDPRDGFRPSPGQITRWRLPGDQDGAVRVDTHVDQGYVVPPHYDSLLCKVITRGANRDEAIARMLRALDELVCDGVATTIPFHQQVLRSEAFRSHRYDTRTLPGWP